MAESGTPNVVGEPWAPPASIDEARARARERFKTRLQAGEKIGECGCADDDAVLGLDDSSPAECVVGVRFRDSGRVYYFRAGDRNLAVGDWVVVRTGRGDEAGRVVIAPHQVRLALLQGELGQVQRRLDAEDIERMEAFRRGGADAIRMFGARARARQVPVKPIAADFSFDGAIVHISYSVPDRERTPDAAALRALAQDVARELQSRVELRQVGPRDEARLLGGLGRCGRTLCCSSWLPVFPEISMSMAKNQDLPLNPSKVSGVCGRLLCCLSYENEQYRQMKAVMPRLGQPIETPAGPGIVVSMHLLKELVTVKLDDESTDVTFKCEELGLGSPRVNESASSSAPRGGQTASSQGQVDDASAAEQPAAQAEQRGGRRRRRGRRRGGASA